VLPAPFYYLHDGQIFRMERDGTTISQITDEPQFVAAFDVSPVSGNLAYIAPRSDSENALVLTDPFGGDVQERVRGPIESPLFFYLAPPSLDSEKIAYRVYDEVPGLEVGVDVSPPGVFFVFSQQPGRPARLTTADFVAVEGDQLPEAGDTFLTPYARTADDAGLILSIAIFPEGSGLAFYLPGHGEQPTVTLRTPEGTPLPCCDIATPVDAESPLEVPIYVSAYDPFVRDTIPAGLWRIDAGDGVGALVLPAQQEGRADVLLIDEPFVTPEGEVLAFVASVPTLPNVFAGDLPPPLRLHRIEGNGSGPLVPLSEETHAVEEGWWSPDGSGVIIRVTDPTSGQPSFIWVPADGSPSTVLPLGADFVQLIRWGRE
jgi:hypothetical protein